MNRFRTLCRLAQRLAVIALGVPGVLAGTSPANPSAAAAFRVGFARSMFVAVNEADARVSIRIWSLTLGRERGVPVDPEPRLFTSPDEIRQSWRSAAVDAVLLPTHELATIRADLDIERFLAAVHSNDPSETYLLLTRTNQPLRHPRELAGRRWLAWQSSRMAIASFWIRYRLDGPPEPAWDALLVGRSESTKLIKVILPVYFGQAEACLVTEYGYRTTIELNPQVGRELRIVAKSPGIIPAVLIFRRGFDPTLRDRCVDEVLRLHTSPAGQQLLNIFQSDRVAEIKPADLEPTLDLLRERAASSEDAP